MAEKQVKEDKKKQETKVEKKEKEKLEKKQSAQHEEYESLVRILVYDIPGSKNLYSGLTRVKGISWTISNAICLSLGLDRNKKIQDLTKPEIEKIEKFIANLNIPDFLKNRQKDPETGETKHYLGNDLDMKREFDIKKMKKIKSYKGIRHSSKLPVRGQRTRSHFRERGRAVGVQKKAK
ncbi:30S ribosomal protein S13 [Candidatus Pacearchaeota archaeon]|nr:30S ribosomal protein S13 [Candidatus Pacearchaeota archaeon]